MVRTEPGGVKAGTARAVPVFHLRRWPEPEPTVAMAVPSRLKVTVGGVPAVCGRTRATGV